VDLEEKDLWSSDGILAQCHIDDVLRANAHFSSLCQVQESNAEQKKCCRSWSPATYVALLSNRSSCLGVTENDLSSVKTLLQRCADYYHNHKLLPNCEEDYHCQKHVPSECYAKNAVYHLLHYLLDVNFIPSSVSIYFYNMNIVHFNNLFDCCRRQIRKRDKIRPYSLLCYFFRLQQALQL